MDWLLLPARNILLDTASSYPPLLLWGNVFCAVVCYRLHPPPNASGPLFGLFYSFVCFAYPGCLISNIIALGRVPSCFTHSTVVLAHVVAFLAVNFSPFDVVYSICKQRHVIMLLNQLAWLDNFTSAFGLMMLCRHSLAQGLLAGFLMNVGGSAFSVALGRTTFRKTVPSIYYYMLSLAAFYVFAMRACAPHDDHEKFSIDCMQQSRWFEGLVVLGTLRATVPAVTESSDAAIKLVVSSVQSVASALGFVYWPELERPQRRNSVDKTQ